MANWTEWIIEETKAFLNSLIFPFREKDFWRKTPFFVVVAFIPPLNLLLLRGWRLELTRRMGWNFPDIIPPSKVENIIRYFINGLKLWTVTWLYTIVPFVILTLTGMRFNTRVMRRHFWELWDYLWNWITGEVEQGIIAFVTAWAFTLFFKILVTFLVNNLWLLIYIPMYRIAMIRTALTGKYRASHLAVRANFRFFRRNFQTIFLMYALFFLENVTKFLVSAVLAATIVLTPLIPFVLVFVSYWSSGYDYGLLAQRMVAQEGIQPLSPVPPTPPPFPPKKPPALPQN